MPEPACVRSIRYARMAAQNVLLDTPGPVEKLNRDSVPLLGDELLR